MDAGVPELVAVFAVMLILPARNVPLYAAALAASGVCWVLYAIPGGGYPLLCLLICSVYAASQVSPTHFCLSLSCEHFSVPLSSLIRHTIPIIVCFLIADYL